MDILTKPWPWYIAGPSISLVLFLMLFFGKSFGVSGNYRTMCAMIGAGRGVKFFDFDWKKEKWNLVFIVGVLLGALIAYIWMPNGQVNISEATIEDLKNIGIAMTPNMLPDELFGAGNVFTFRSLFFMTVGGFLVGFGTRYAGGCTSGHAISGLSDLQLPSLVAVIGFFIGGLLMTHLLLPYLLKI